MKGDKKACSFNDVLDLFEDYLSEADILASGLLAKISTAVVKKRIEMKMTQTQFAEYLKVSQSMVSKWESEDYNFTIKALAEIAVALDLDLKVQLADRKKEFNNTSYEYPVRAYFTSSDIYDKKILVSSASYGQNVIRDKFLKRRDKEVRSEKFYERIPMCN